MISPMISWSRVKGARSSRSAGASSGSCMARATRWPDGTWMVRRRFGARTVGHLAGAGSVLSGSASTKGAPAARRIVSMDAEAVRAALQHYFDYSATDEDVAHDIYHLDAVLEFPQSGER